MLNGKLLISYGKLFGKSIIVKHKSICTYKTHYERVIEYKGLNFSRQNCTKLFGYPTIVYGILFLKIVYFT